ncbi:MAG: ATP-binding cassette domain-containing protein [Nocardiopsaceae bacterium]|jgi:oligopeptide/dipeptide ABC transporter ATP-binding protein|nr:ATP-binding cassette domain-containing protein [Nocardiopsaceae bacterium]
MTTSEAVPDTTVSSTASQPATSPLLSVRNLVKEFTLKAKAGDFGKRVLRAVDDVSFDLAPGQVLGLVGESGCGKSTTARCILRLIEPTSGEVVYKGEDLIAKSHKQMRELRKELQMVFQDPYSSLHPRRRIRHTIAEPMIVQGVNQKEALARVPDLMRTVQLDPRRADAYPHEFSGGQRQRIGIARALSVDPEVLVLDEPLSALDVSVQADIINLLPGLQRELGLAFIFISHNLSVVRYLAGQVGVMYLGQIVEIGEADEVLARPAHPYTKALLSAAPVPDPEAERRKQQIVLGGEVPSALDPPAGCRFHPRCWLAQDICRAEAPPLIERGNGHPVACHFAAEVVADKKSHLDAAQD